VHLPDGWVRLTPSFRLARCDEKAYPYTPAPTLPGNAVTPEPVAPKRPTHYLWAVQIAAVDCLMLATQIRPIKPQTLGIELTRIPPGMTPGTATLSGV